MRRRGGRWFNYRASRRRIHRLVVPMSLDGWERRMAKFRKDERRELGSQLRNVLSNGLNRWSGWHGPRRRIGAKMACCHETCHRMAWIVRGAGNRDPKYAIYQHAPIEGRQPGWRGRGGRLRFDLRPSLAGNRRTDGRSHPRGILRAGIERDGALNPPAFSGTTSKVMRRRGGRCSN